MTPEERAILIWNASSQSKQDRESFIAFVAEHIDVATKPLRVENARLLAALADIVAYGFNGRIHPADRVRKMVQMAHAAAGGE